MELFEGYVLQAELAQKAGVTISAVCQTKSIIKKMGNLTCISKRSLSPRYREIAENRCLDLKEYCSFSALSLELGMSHDYLAVMKKYKPFEYKKVGGINLFKLNEKFITD